MSTSWRSWFWNIVSMVAMFFMAVGGTASLFTTRNSLVLIGFGAISLVLWVGVVRAPMLGVSVRPRGIVVRRLARTTVVPWNEVEQIREGGLAGVVGVGCPVIVRRRPGGELVELELDVLGSYGIIRPRRGPAARAVADLNKHLENWRRQHADEGV